MKHPRTLNFLSLLALLAVGQASATGTPAGTQITNQATVTYRDSDTGTRQGTNSNEVSTLVKQVAGLTITLDGSVAQPGQQQQAVPGGEVVYPYTLTNTGNGTDSFKLNVLTDTSLAGGVSPAAAPVVYADTNGDGILQPGERVSLPVSGSDVLITNVAADSQQRFFVVYQVPITALSTQTISTEPRGTSVFDASKQDGYGGATTENYARTNVVQDAVITSTKQVLSVTRDGLGNLTARYRISVTNSGVRDATGVVVTDDVIGGLSDLPAGSVIDANPATYGSTPAGAAVSIPAPDTIQASLGTLVAGQTAQFDFQVLIPSSAAPTTAANPYTNVADIQFAENRNADLNGDTVPDPVHSNAADISKAPVALLGLGPSGDPNGAADATIETSYTSPEGVSITPGTSTNDDTQLAASVPSGSSVTFTQTLINNGDATDTFNMAAVLAGLPAGSVVQLLRADGTPLADSNGDGIVDSGPLASGQRSTILVKVLFPARDAGGLPVSDPDGGSVVITATSVLENTVSNATTDLIGAVTAPSVAFGDRDPGANGGNPALTPVVNAVPGAVVTFPMEAGNNGGQPDTYNLSGSVTFPTTAGPVTVPVTYYLDSDGDGVLSPAELAAGPVTTTGTLQPGTELKLIASVTVPAGATAGPVSVNQTATSPVTGTTAADTNDVITVKSIYDLSLSTDRSGTTTSPGTALYQHTLANVGNAPLLPGDLAFTATQAGATTGWTNLYSLDGVNFFPTAEGAFADGASRNLLGGDGKLDPNESVPLYVKVNVPSGEPTEALNQSTLSVSITKTDTPAGPSDTVDVLDTVANPARVTDTTRVVGGKLNASKSVVNCGADLLCAAPVSGADAFPNEYLRYTLSARNLSADPLSEVLFKDTVPAYTSLYAVGGPANGYYRIDGGAWIAVSTPLGAPRPAGTLLEFAADTDGVAGITPNDTVLAPGVSLDFTLTVKVN
ncbi:beta strand repeat-containing protein [Deinococcus koreensis]|uniref:DUF11 domain-containing protein n=1 Tax=Deinococcus koreensis TaxID=2054903 RepID=A0A2K3USP2_9DEIO|nr:DUF11 domain-containing protein [Deinococcus koreensis]PNY79537.1 hypothetical protein CVO96_19110 [Deinococcus koreensis]